MKLYEVTQGNLKGMFWGYDKRDAIEKAKADPTFAWFGNGLPYKAKKVRG